MMTSISQLSRVKPEHWTRALAHRGMVVAKVRRHVIRFPARAHMFDDLVQEGVLRLAVAASCFRPELGQYYQYASKAVDRHLARVSKTDHRPEHVDVDSPGRPSGIEDLADEATHHDRVEISRDLPVIMGRIKRYLSKRHSKRDREIWWRRQAGESHRSIGARLGISGQRAQQVEALVQASVDRVAQALRAE